jgi:hypothetical protein
MSYVLPPQDINQWGYAHILSVYHLLAFSICFARGSKNHCRFRKKNLRILSLMAVVLYDSWLPYG